MQITFFDFIRNADKNVLGRRNVFLTNLDFEKFVIVVQEIVTNKLFMLMEHIFSHEEIINLPRKWEPLGNVSSEVINQHFNIKNHAYLNQYADDFCSNIESQFKNIPHQRKKTFASPKRSHNW